MKLSRKYFRTFGVASVAGALSLTMVTASGASSGGLAAGAPVKIGISLSLSGDFSADGLAFQQGYKLWAADVNKAGGLLGHKVVLDIVSDASSPTQVVTNYQKLVSSDKVNLTFGPFSSLLSLPAGKTLSRYGYALVEGAGGGPSVFQAGLHNIFDVSLPVANNLMPFATWITSLPKSVRPTSVAYVTSNDPFTQPQLTTIEGTLSKAGIKQVYNKVFPAEVTDFTPIADAVAAAKPQVVVLGSTDVPTVSAFMQAFEQSGFSPKVFIATGGPDQGSTFIKAVGASNANGIMVPNAWYGGSANPLSKKMVAEYIKQYGGTAAGVSSDVVEAYSVGEVVAQAVKATGGFDNKKIIAYLHSGAVLSSAQGPVKFNSVGENVTPTAFTFQWQGSKFVQVNPVHDPNSVKVLFPKPAWGK
ncbi:MAG: amino acid ABC transporter substrate-binding protein [Acidobacteriota bacterium]|nr:amino acid ABC transporter substrate-binding protein [Acidobacteriota bacterium]MDE3093118.1 amino acid ABC transporter substrate-binding protein [Acidobacteriota bacterium]MDE3139992.1 amino acid ABC transporter substrate-binding protein [Acidobacteriota bacterium]MDE3146756.1 amino acid ABC transporter substrate-binding protein [Acidobacteriota bacterium]